jgi:nucleotide-binding universal stress UspA family protein
VPDKPAPAFTRVVVALNGGPSDARILRLVLDLAKPIRAEVVAVHVVEIDWTQPLDANVAEMSEDAQRVLDMAETQAEHAGHPLEAVLVQARDVGAAIVDEAVERAADLLVVGLPYRKKFGGDFAIGKVVPYVLKNAPCAVWVAREPMPEEYRS